MSSSTILKSQGPLCCLLKSPSSIYLKAFVWLFSLPPDNCTTTVWPPSNLLSSHLSHEVYLNYCVYNCNPPPFSIPNFLPLLPIFREGKGNPLQCSCLEIAMGRGAWRAAVHGVEKSRTRLSDFTFTHWRRKWQPTPVFLPGESQGRGSLVGCHLWGRTELDRTQAT